MNTFKNAQGNGDNKVAMGTTGDGTTTSVESLISQFNGGHPGGQVSIACVDPAEGVARLRELASSDCSEIPYA